MAEYYDSDVDGAENGKLVSLLEQTALALEEGAAWKGQRTGLKERDATVESGAYTERLRSSLMALISIFLRPIVDRTRCQGSSNGGTVTYKRGVRGRGGGRGRGQEGRCFEAAARRRTRLQFQAGQREAAEVASGKGEASGDCIYVCLATRDGAVL